jgi:hypothetical protein
MGEANGKNGFSVNLRFITPCLITVAIFLLGGIFNTVGEINDKLFKHLTNDEIHTPRSVVVSKAEFSIYQELRKSQMEDIKEMVKSQIEQLRVDIRNSYLREKGK